MRPPKGGWGGPKRIEMVEPLHGLFRAYLCAGRHPPHCKVHVVHNIKPLGFAFEKIGVDRSPNKAFYAVRYGIDQIERIDKRRDPWISYRRFQAGNVNFSQLPIWMWPFELLHVRRPFRFV